MPWGRRILLPFGAPFPALGLGPKAGGSFPQKRERCRCRGGGFGFGGGFGPEPLSPPPPPSSQLDLLCNNGNSQFAQ
jgi:hypothetical protein